MNLTHAQLTQAKKGVIDHGFKQESFLSLFGTYKEEPD